MRLHRQYIARPRIKLSARLVSLRIDKVDARETMATERACAFFGRSDQRSRELSIIFLGR